MVLPVGGRDGVAWWARVRVGRPASPPHRVAEMWGLSCSSGTSMRGTQFFAPGFKKISDYFRFSEFSARPLHRGAKKASIVI